ncbi:hypothetical protein NOR_00797 [Metarhizium rileyi]|uniref:Uncharacterized protein n=1 Tax=Metarhizium rileyi (strain RCEF 4871) TaxID=1649241 RepID=A0A167JJ59_METRR|nr:hypothetical protein NOR_00797 [Metarhizium rileyi RCEF 4871]
MADSLSSASTPDKSNIVLSGPDFAADVILIIIWAFVFNGLVYGLAGGYDVHFVLRMTVNGHEWLARTAMFLGTWKGVSSSLVRVR